MKNSSKAALLSGLVCPGAGHLYLNKYIPGSVLVGATLYVLYVLISHVLARAREITDKILSGEVTPDVMVIREMIQNQADSVQAQQITTVTGILIVVWIVGVIDSYRLGMAKDRNHTRQKEIG